MAAVGGVLHDDAQAPLLLHALSQLQRHLLLHVLPLHAAAVPFRVGIGVERRLDNIPNDVVQAAHVHGADAPAAADRARRAPAEPLRDALAAKRVCARLGDVRRHHEVVADVALHVVRDALHDGALAALGERVHGGRGERRKRRKRRVVLGSRGANHRHRHHRRRQGGFAPHTPHHMRGCIRRRRWGVWGAKPPIPLHRHALAHAAPKLRLRFQRRAPAATRKPTDAVRRAGERVRVRNIDLGVAGRHRCCRRRFSHCRHESCGRRGTGCAGNRSGVFGRGTGRGSQLVGGERLKRPLVIGVRLEAIPKRVANLNSFAQHGGRSAKRDDGSSTKHSVGVARYLDCVDVRAVGRTQVVQRVLSAVEGEGGVLPGNQQRHAHRVDHDVVVRVAADAKNRHVHERPRCTRPRHERGAQVDCARELPIVMIGYAVKHLAHAASIVARKAIEAARAPGGNRTGGEAGARERYGVGSGRPARPTRPAGPKAWPRALDSVRVFDCVRRGISRLQRFDCSSK